MDQRRRAGSGALRSGDLIVDLGSETVSLSGGPVPISGRAFEVLVLLMARAPDLVTKEDILEAIWSGIPVTEGVLTTALKDIRKAIGDSARHPNYIETRHGRGYRFLGPVETVAERDAIVAGLPVAVVAPAAVTAAQSWFQGKHRRVALAALVVSGMAALAASLFSPPLAGVGAQARLSIISDSPGLAEAVNDALFPTGLRDAAFAQQEFTLQLTAQAASNADHIDIALSDGAGDIQFTVWDMDAGALTLDQRAQRISMEVSNVIRCSDSLITDAEQTGMNAQSLRDVLMRYCLAAQRPGEGFDTIAIATTLYERLPNEPFAMALLAVSIGIKPEQYFFGQSVEQVVLLRQEARDLALRASAGGNASALVAASGILTADLQLALPALLEESAGISIDSWAGSRVGLTRSIQLRQLGRIQEARLLVDALDARWTGYQDVHVHRIFLGLTTGRAEVVAQLADEYQSLYPEESLRNIIDIAYLFYGSSEERRERIDQAPARFRDNARACFEPLSSPDSVTSEWDNSAMVEGCIALDLTVGARVAAMLGLTGLSIDLLDRIDPEASGISVIFYYPEFERVRETERFADIAASFGLVDSWRITGRLPDFCHEQIEAPVCIRSIFE